MSLQSALATLIPILGLIGAIMLWLIKESKDAGRRESKIDKVLDEIHDVKRNVEKVPVLENRIGQVEEMYSSLRSDIKELLRRNGRGSWPDREE